MMTQSRKAVQEICFQLSLRKGHIEARMSFKKGHAEFFAKKRVDARIAEKVIWKGLLDGCKNT
jgi:hypothetical protein